jgi:hypothetical protein
MPATRTKAIRLHLLYYLVAAAMFLLIWYYSSLDDQVVQPQLQSFSNMQEKELEAFLDMNRLLTTLATAVGAGIGAIIFNRLKNQPHLYQILLAGASFLFAGSSLYFGYISYHKVVWMLHSRFFDLSIKNIVLPEHLQFLTLVLALLAFGDFALSSLLEPHS